MSRGVNNISVQSIGACILLQVSLVKTSFQLGVLFYSDG